MGKYLEFESMSEGLENKVIQDLKFKTGNFVWRIKFNVPLDPKTVNNVNLYVTSLNMSPLRTSIRYNSLENEIALRNDKISELKAKSQQKIIEWKVITSETTNDTILLADTIIMEQGETIDLLSKNLADCDSASSIKDTIIQNKSLVVMDLYDQLQYTNDELVLCEKKRQSWWNRNKLWIGLGVGVIVGGGGVLLIK